MVGAQEIVEDVIAVCAENEIILEVIELKNLGPGGSKPANRGEVEQKYLT